MAKYDKLNILYDEMAKGIEYEFSYEKICILV